MHKLSPRELRAILDSEGCDCSPRQRETRGEGCTRRIIRCNGRQRWMAKNDKNFRRVWAGWMGIPKSAARER